METVKELIRYSTSLLNNNDMSSTGYSRPQYPTCIFYFGRRSQAFHSELIADITRGWGGNVDYVKFYGMDDPDSDAVSDMRTGSSLDVFAMREQLTEMLSAQMVYADMTHVALYCILDTTDISDMEVFRKWYRRIDRIREIFGGIYVRSMFMVVLNESLALTENARAIKKTIKELYEDENTGGANSHLYDSVFIFSNRQKNGAFIKLDPADPDYENYNLFADVILLSNTRDAEYNNRAAQLYGSNKPAMLTAYGYYQKPMSDIILISLNIIFNKIRDFMSSKAVTADVLSNALGTANGRFAVYDRFFNEIRELMPGDDFLAFLPGKGISAATFAEVDRATTACLGMFLQQNHVGVVRRELLSRKEYIKKDTIESLAGTLNDAQLVNGISGDVLNTVFDKASMAYSNPEGMPVGPAMETIVRKEIANGLRPVIEEALSEAVVMAKDGFNCFRQLSGELEKLYAVGEGAQRKNLVAFYGDKINRYYNDPERVRSLMNRVLAIGITKEEMLQELYSELKKMFESDPVYRASFFEELTARLGALDSGARAQEFIGQELVNNLGDRIGLFSANTFRERTFEAYMLNTASNGGVSDNLMYSYLKARAIPGEIGRTFFNTCSNDMAESIWFYPCSPDNLIY